MMEKQDWIWMPHPAHFICAHDCRFVMATYVGNYIVSTVGELVLDSALMRLFADTRGAEHLLKYKGDEFQARWLNEIGYEDLGYERKYETMVFKAVASNEPNSCCPYRCDVYGGEIDMRGYNNSGEAYKGHMELCEKWSKIEEGAKARWDEEEDA